MKDNITQFPGNTDVRGTVAAADLQFNQRLTPDVAIGIGKALARFQELSNTKIVTPNSQAEIAGLGQFLFNSFVAYASDLLGCWHTTRNEYEPLVMLFASISSHVDRVKQQVAQQQAQVPKQS